MIPLVVVMPMDTIMKQKKVANVRTPCPVPDFGDRMVVMDMAPKAGIESQTIVLCTKTPQGIVPRG
jgi:hypothetical protein